MEHKMTAENYKVCLEDFKRLALSDKSSDQKLAHKIAEDVKETTGQTMTLRNEYGEIVWPKKRRSDE